MNVDISHSRHAKLVVSVNVIEGDRRSIVPDVRPTMLNESKLGQHIRFVLRLLKRFSYPCQVTVLAIHLSAFMV